MLRIDEVTESAYSACSVCDRDGAMPCEDCGRDVCELHGAGYRWADAHHTAVLPHLCTVCETTRLLEDERASREEAVRLQVAAEVPRSEARSPAVELLRWARHVWPLVERDGDGVSVGLQVREADVDLEALKSRVVTLLGRLGLAGVDDRVIAPWLWEILRDAGVDASGEVPVSRRFFAGYTNEIGHYLMPLPGRLEGAPRVLGAVLTEETILWGEFAIDRDAGVSPVGGFEERGGCGGLNIAVLSATARLIPQQLLR